MTSEEVRLGYSVQSDDAMGLVSALAKAHAQHALDAWLTQYSKSRLLIIGELAYRCGSVLITSYRPVMDWGGGERCLVIRESPRRSSTSEKRM